MQISEIPMRLALRAGAGAEWTADPWAGELRVTLLPLPRPHGSWWHASSLQRRTMAALVSPRCSPPSIHHCHLSHGSYLRQSGTKQAAKGAQWKGEVEPIKRRHTQSKHGIVCVCRRTSVVTNDPGSAALKCAEGSWGRCLCRRERRRELGGGSGSWGRPQPPCTLILGSWQMWIPEDREQAAKGSHTMQGASRVAVHGVHRVHVHNAHRLSEAPL